MKPFTVVVCAYVVGYVLFWVALVGFGCFLLVEWTEPKIYLPVFAVLGAGIMGAVAQMMDKSDGNNPS